MGEVSYRNWDIWISNQWVEYPEKLKGTFECFLLPTLMTQQTLEFLEHQYETSLKQITKNPYIDFSTIKPPLALVDGNLCLKIRDVLSANQSISDTLKEVMETIDAISMCVDAALTCTSVRFTSDLYGQIFFANRRPIGRGMAFEVEERVIAAQKIDKDFSYYRNPSDRIRVAMAHYLTGLSLLGLEDQNPGLIEAAFMQFFQGCEAAGYRDNKNGASEVCKYIAMRNPSDSEDLQVAAWQVWQVRNSYFGHGGVSDNLRAIRDFENAYKISKQVLVARYVCKRLIDLGAPSHTALIREMRFYPQKGSEAFSGKKEELSSTFHANFGGRKVKIYDADENVISEYVIPSLT